MELTRQSFIGSAAMVALAATGVGATHALAKELASSDDKKSLKPLPAPDPDPTSQFGVDKNINIGTIDDYIGRDDVAYRDVRMLFDPADYGAIGGDADLSTTIAGFKIVPYPYLATLNSLPVNGAYNAETLYELTWDESGGIIAAEPNYVESRAVLDDLFPKDKAIFLMCGGGGYAGMTKALLTFLGWDESKLYNIGGNWAYSGDNAVELKVYPESASDEPYLATWRADYAYIEFDKLHPAKA
jgi:rhodanese-related sulfurtransferase